MSRLFFRLRGLRSYRGSALLASCGERISHMLIAVAFLWGLTSWAMGWW
ncbi:MAG: hypothetical protein ABI228_01795 [Burkholderiaceae bacterium]